MKKILIPTVVLVVILAIFLLVGHIPISKSLILDYDDISLYVSAQKICSACSEQYDTLCIPYAYDGITFIDRGNVFGGDFSFYIEKLEENKSKLTLTHKRKLLKRQLINPENLFYNIESDSKSTDELQNFFK